MALPSTGDTWANILEPNLLPTAIRKGIITDILARDYRLNGQPRNLADPAAGLNSSGVFTPFATDGQLRSDLLITASGTNLGFFHCGLLKEDGWTFEPDLTVDQTPVAQSPWSARNDVTKISGKLMFSMREWIPLADRLMMDLPLVDASGNSLVPDPGVSNYSVAAPAYQNLCERQFIALGFDGDTNFAITVTRASQSKLGKVEAQKKNPADRDFNYEMLIDPMTQAPYIISFGGTGWAGEGGVPTFPGSAPVAAATTTGKATLTFTNVTGIDGPFTYAGEVSTDGGTTWTAGTPDGATWAAATTVGTTSTVAKFTGLTAGATVLRIKATGTNGATTTSLTSNSITVT